MIRRLADIRYNFAMPRGRRPKVPVKTLKVRVKDRHVAVLNRMAFEVNTVWNACNAHQIEVFRREGRFFSGFDFAPFVRGASQEFDLIGSSTIDEIAAEYAAKRRAARKCRLRWRRSGGKRRSLGWVPFKSRATRWTGGAVRFAGLDFGVWDSYGLGDYAFRAGAFVEDARGRWYFCVQVAVAPGSGHAGNAVGIDLGLKDIAVTSDGDRLEHGRWYRRTQDAVGRAARAGKKQRVRALHAKVKNQRRDALHKWARRTVDRCAEIVIGDVRPSAVGKTTLAKSVYDSGWTMLRGMLKYKSEHAGIRCDVVSERNSTRTCSCCGAIPDSSPRGRAGLRIREWTCCECGARHDRDVNAARNILVAGHRHPAEGIPGL